MASDDAGAQTVEWFDLPQSFRIDLSDFRFGNFKDYNQGGQSVTVVDQDGNKVNKHGFTFSWVKTGTFLVIHLATDADWHEDEGKKYWATRDAIYVLDTCALPEEDKLMDFIHGLLADAGSIKEEERFCIVFDNYGRDKFHPESVLSEKNLSSPRTYFSLFVDCFVSDNGRVALPTWEKIQDLIEPAEKQFLQVNEQISDDMSQKYRAAQEAHAILMETPCDDPCTENDKECDGKKYVCLIELMKALSQVNHNPVITLSIPFIINAIEDCNEGMKKCPVAALELADR
ncbi:MAG: hypothetical protein ABW189_03545 [Rickettsiales bacterium]